MKALKQCPILMGIAVIAIALSILSFALQGTTYSRFSEPASKGEVPVLTIAFKAALEGVYPWSRVTDDHLDIDGDGTADLAEIPVETIEEVKEPEEVEVIDEEPQEVIQEETEVVEEPQEEVYELTSVDADYFNDAVFIGDSRTVGLSEYCQELDERATFYSKVSLTIYDVMKKEFIKTDNGKIGLEQALSENQYGKVYIMLGLNEIGTGNAEYFRDAYAEVLDRIKELQPDAIIYIQGIMHVTAAKSDKDKYFNNDNINERNEAISQLADDKQVFFIDMNEAVDDGNGNLDGELSFDDVHLKASSYDRWYGYLLDHAIVR